jgi:hypothetical protein
MEKSELATRIIANVILYTIFFLMAILIGALFLWVSVEVFEIGRWSWLNALAIGILIFVLKGLFQTRSRSD